MSTNHLLQAVDLKGPHADALVGSYLRMNVFPDQRLTLADVSPTPLLFADALPWIAVPMPSALVRQGTIDVKSRGQICDQADIAASSAEVVALFCPSRDAKQPCTALVRLAKTEADKLQTALAGKIAPEKIQFKPTCK
jgi:hypothetical protein